MTVDLDSNVVVALALDTEHAPAINRSLREWRGTEEGLHAPALFRYEIASALTRYIVAGAIDLPDATAAWRRAIAMPVVLHALEDGPAAIEIARSLKRKSAYDAAYVALAQELGAELWTVDGPLARNAASVALPVRLLET